MIDTADGLVSVSHPGQLAAAEFTLEADSVLVVSIYGVWEWMVPQARSVNDRYAVPSVHRALSDLTRLFFENDRRIVVAGDLNIWRGEGQWAARYQTMFDRFEAEGFTLCGPFGRDG